MKTNKSLSLDSYIIKLPQLQSRIGSITAVSSFQDIPFEIKRAYYLYDIPAGASRGGHAHKQLKQLIVAMRGSFDVVLDDGFNKKTIHLSAPNCGLFIGPGIWRELVNFSASALVITLASTLYDENDYIRDYDEFLKYKGA